MSRVMQEQFRIDFSRNKIDVHRVQPVHITGRDLMRPSVIPRFTTQRGIRCTTECPLRHRLF